MIRTVIEFSLRLRTLIVAFAAVLVAAGVWHMRSVPLDVVPEFSPVKLIVKTEALGLSSTEVEVAHHGADRGGSAEWGALAARRSSRNR